LPFSAKVVFRSGDFSDAFSGANQVALARPENTLPESTLDDPPTRHARPVKVAVVGLGQMGGAIARKLLGSGVDLVVLDHNPERSAHFAGTTAGIAGMLNELADVDVVVTALPNDEAVGSGLVDHSQKSTVAARARAEKKTVGQRS
jgi:phosphoglycerate dehydrogenase-like enzyme